MDYKQTVFLPKTEFPMRGGLPQKEPEILERWQKLGLYDQLRKARKNAPKFVYMMARLMPTVSCTSVMR